MDTANLEDAARHYREAEAALNTARDHLQAQAVSFLQQYAGERGAQATAARITGWSREHLRGLAKKAQEDAERARREAEVEALRQKVEELSTPKKPSPAAAAPRRQVTETLPPPARPRRREPEPRDGRPLTDDEAKTLADLARSRATRLQTEALEQITGQLADGVRDFAVVSESLGMGLLTHDEVYGPASSGEGDE